MGARAGVIGVRLGPGANGMPLKLQWYQHHKAVGRQAKIELNAGDIYISSEKVRAPPYLQHSVTCPLPDCSRISGRRCIVSSQLSMDGSESWSVKS